MYPVVMASALRRTWVREGKEGMMLVLSVLVLRLNLVEGVADSLLADGVERV